MTSLQHMSPGSSDAIQLDTKCRK